MEIVTVWTIIILGLRPQKLLRYQCRCFYHLTARGKPGNHLLNHPQFWVRRCHKFRLLQLKANKIIRKARIVSTSLTNLSRIDKKWYHKVIRLAGLRLSNFKIIWLTFIILLQLIRIVKVNILLSHLRVFWYLNRIMINHSFLTYNFFIF